MNDFAKMQLIEAYHSHQLDAAQQIQFDELYLNDMEFAKQVEDFKPIFEGFEMLHLEAFEKQIQSWEAAHQQSNPSNNSHTTLTVQSGGRWRRLLAYVAAAAIFIAAPILYFQTQTATPTDQFAQFFNPNTSAVVIPTVRAGGLNPAQELQKRALEAYVRKDFAAALPLLQEYTSLYKDSTHTTKNLRLYIGIAQLGLNKAAESVQSLEEFLAFNEESLADYRKEAEWTLALAYHRNGQKDKCLTILQQIAQQPNNEYSSNAQKMYGMLNQK